MFTRSMSVLAVVCCYSFSYAEDSVEIPLDTVWALNIHGTKNIRELELKRKSVPQTDEEFIRTSSIEQISQALNHNHKPEKGAPARKAFAVSGNDLDALRNARDVLLGKKGRSDSFKSDEDIWLVFYTYNQGRSVHLEEIKRQANAVTVKYHLNIPEGFISPTASPCFAFIPLGKLPPGKVSVSIERLPDVGGTEFIKQRYASQDNLVCDSFSFDITSDGN
jgi:hypothetical protein